MKTDFFECPYERKFQALKRLKYFSMVHRVGKK